MAIATNPAGRDDVLAFYERYPYPRPLADLGDYRVRWQDRQRRRAEFHASWPATPFREDRSILIAGCGTSQAAKHAMRWPEARVVAVDISETSVRCTRDLKARHGLDNLEVHQLGIEAIAGLGGRFDQIVCTGVLHHLPDPDAGLAALRSVLAVDGAMELMVYAPYGRAGIYLLQDFCRRLGIRATDEEIPQLIAALMLLPKGHPLENLLRQAPDFREEAALADALLNPLDRAYAVPQFFELIARAGLSFGRWARQAEYLPHCGALARIPQTDRLRALPPAEQYAAVELFRGTMIRHTAILHRDDHAAAPIGFEGDAWAGYVPIRLPDTLRVVDSLPEGAAAVLVNRTHTYPDLALPIQAHELALFDAIDGRRTIRDIATGRCDPATARRFFQRLWQYDQVVFDASR